MRSFSLRVLEMRTMVSVVLAIQFLGTSVVSAGIFNWGDLHDPAGDVMFLDVEEDNGLLSPLFAPMPGTGSPVAVGNSLILDPQNFFSQSTDGSLVVDSELSTIVMADAGRMIEHIVVSEFGDYSLGGLPGGAATAQVGASFYWQVLEVDGAPVSLPLQTQSLQVSAGGGPNGGIYARPADDGVVVPWEGSILIDVEGFLTANLINGDATKVSLLFDNTLLTAADQFSSAFIKKKGVRIDVCMDDVIYVIPEPASVLLLGIGLSMLGLRRR